MAHQTLARIQTTPARKRLFLLALILVCTISMIFGATLSVFAAGTLTVQVYLDSDRNGTFDSGENGIGGVQIAVYSAESVIVGLNTTDADGQVVFPELPDGDYRIEVSNIGARVVSVPGPNNPGLLSFVTIASGAVTQRIGLRELGGGSIDTGAPVGTRSISVRVWDDSDADGIQDAGEPVFSNLPVRLVDSIGVTVAGPVNTDALGRATFNDAPTGAGYRVRILATDIPTGYIVTQSFVNDGDPNPGIRDSNAVLTGGNVEASLPNTGHGVNIDNVDIGFTRGAISGFVWRDNNRNGLWDTTEPRLNGVTVQLLDTSTSITVETTITRQRIGSTLPEEGGIFVFPSLQLNTPYQVVIPNSEFAGGALLFGAANSPNATGGDVGSPDGVPAGSVTGTSIITLTTGTNTRTDQRFGFYKGVVGDFVWLDDDSDGSQDPGEIGINGVTVFVDDGRGGGIANDGIRNGEEIATITSNDPNTSQPGYYLFDDLPLGNTYRIVIDPANFQPGGALEGLGNSTGTEATNSNGDRYVYIDKNVSASAPEHTNVDFGMTRASIGNRVFEDANGDGVFGPGEAGIPDVTIRAYRASDNTLLGTTTSNSSGVYNLPGLPAEPIYATFELSTTDFVGSLQPSSATIDPTDEYTDYSDLISNVGGSVWRTDIFTPTFIFTPTLNTANNGIDAGFYRPVRIVVRVFGETATINNTLDGGESGIRRVTVQVTGTEAQTLTTNIDGEAIFNLRPGSYTVTVTTPTGYLASPSNTGSASFSNLNSQDTVSADFGYYRPGSISGLTFFDADADGQADSGEPRLRNVTVELVSNNGVITTTTATNGTYTFNNILPGNYTVRFTNPDTGNYVFITGGDSDVTSAGNVGTSSTNTLTVPYNGSLTDINAGFRGRTTVSGRIFEDNNADNLQDAGDTDLSGATVTLTVTANLTNLVATYKTTLNTSASTYAFNNLPGGNGVTYTVTFAPPPSTYIASDANVGSDDTIDSDGPTVTITNPATGVTITNVDQGYFRNVIITARVFRESSAERNNQWDSGENGIGDVRVFLEQGGTPVLTGTTTTGGLVTFSARPGSYNLNVDENSTALSGLLPSSGSTAAVSVTNSLLSSGGSSQTETAPTGTTNVFGFYTFGTVSGRVFFDGTNGAADNQAVGEPGVNSVTVRLLDMSGTAVVTTTTGNNGDFTINNVEGASYRLEFVNPDSTNFSFVAANTGDNSVATLVRNNGRTNLFTVTDGQTTNRSAAMIGTGTVNGITFIDGNYDGQRGGTNDGLLANVTVNLTATVSLSNLNTTITRSIGSDSSGNYSFSGLPTATFSLSFTPPTATPAYQVTQADQGSNTIDSDGTTELTNQTLAAGSTESRDQGYYQNVTVSARVFNETATISNSFESGEAGIRQISVSFNGPVSGTVQTDRFGIATFSGPPGTYTVSIDSDPSGFTRSPGNTGTASTGLIVSGQTATTVPFGYYRTAQINGTVWFDTDSDGQLDSGEPGMQGVSVRLIGNSSGSGTPVTTDLNGAFAITGIEPTGLTNTTYQVCVTLPTGFTPTTQDSTLTNDDTSDIDSSGCTATFTVTSGANITYIDAGLRGALAIGDLVWEDANANGIQDSGEQALAGVTVTVLVTTTGNVINTTNPSFTLSTVSTTASGLNPNYTIGNIPPGSIVTIQTVERFGYLLSAANQGGNSATDSNAVGSSITLNANNTTIDFGLYRTTAVGDTVWLDVNGNGLFDSGEPGLPGITITLRDGNGAAVTTTQTLANGSYTFSNLTPGSYSLQLNLPAGYATTNNGSGSITVDNDNDFRNNGTTAIFALTSGQALAGIDAGLRGTGSVGGIAWFDTNENNIRDSSETNRASGVRVTVIYTPTLTPTLPQTVEVATDTNGAYSVTGLPPGQVTVVFVNRLGYLPAQPNVGDDATDSDGPEATFALDAGQSVTRQSVTRDMGYYPRVMLFLPMTIAQGPPDLIVSVQATPTSPNKNIPVTYRVTVTNVGREPASNFWVDLYVNPSRPPNVNEPWNELSRQGLAWFFDGTLQPGESVTLISFPRSTTNPFGYDPAVSSPTWNGRLPPGSNTIYVYVDSWNRNVSGDIRSSFAAIEEGNETNNRADITIVVSE